VLVFAHSARDAKRLGWRTIKEWTGSEYLVVARPLPGKEGWLSEQEGVDLEGEPRMIESPKACQRCEMWGRTPLNAFGVCEFCDMEEEFEERHTR
jgi:hypothetical protein